MTATTGLFWSMIFSENRLPPRINPEQLFPHHALRENSHMHCCDDCSASRVSPLLPSRRTMIIGLTSAAVLSASRASAATGTSADDERFMRLALDEARQGDYR
jgi:hypothetical protein